MTIPQFPSQDLAKLVLGYLAEEQLMTAYDEFLQASPYLDALQNEYDRIFMTSLKSILAEYRAVKIYVETCKPLILRKKIFQCTNLLDIVKLLVNHVDLNKLQSQETERVSVDKHHSVNANKSNTCETCASSKLVSCVCKLRALYNKQSSHIEPRLQNSIETTPLADLPGNQATTRKKQVKVLEKDSLLFIDGQSSGSSEKESSSICIEENIDSHSIHLKNDISSGSLDLTVKAIDQAESQQKIEEFDNVLKSVLDKNNTVTGSENKPNQRVSNVSTFQDFTSGVSGGESQNPNVPDSSTSESLSIQVPLTKDYKDTMIGPPKRQLLLQLGPTNGNIDLQTYRKDKTSKYAKIKPKSDDQKVKILSDVKVINKKKTLKNATSTPVTSTPLVQMQTIVINGNSAYNRAPVVTKHLYTKDEIMAMPTLIVVPASGPSITSANCKPITTQKCSAAPKASTTAQPLGPLVIDVPPTPATVKQPEVTTNLTDLNTFDTGLVKTVDFTKNASVPKDNVTCAATKTPLVLPPVRKSSSTPRRTTHVRVLDFTTPRRILHETINEQVTSQATDAPAEIVLSSSPNESFVDTTVAENTIVNTNTNVNCSNAIVQNADACDTDTGSAKENNTTSKLNTPKKSNWDADLRAIVAHDSALPSLITKRKKNSKKKKAAKDGKADKKSKNIISPNIKKLPKKRRKVIEDDDDDPPPDTIIKPDVPVKPTINIISGSDRVVTDIQPAPLQDVVNNEVVLNKSNDKDDECAETPEGDRLSLQNVIGARLNISDLLETPYKQALYDIQMGTPRFLPDLPGEPLSDIKITNIPTPRFLDTPKPVEATPSSWSSRPTDYSSGGSYYKPDDQDYMHMPIPDLRCVVSSSSKEDIISDKCVEIKKNDKKSRPQRQCAKNVSYYRFGSSTNKIKEADDTFDAASTCSDSTGSDCKNKEPVQKTPRDRSRLNRTDTKKRVPCKKKKSPAIKEKAKTFLNIRPRQTPVKLTPSRNKKRAETPGYRSPNKIKRNRIISKNVNSTPLVVAAPTKSRRKSSTPRKLHCTKSFNHTSPETIVNTKQNAVRDIVQDSDTEQIALRWSDDGSQDAKNKELATSLTNECEDISQIQEYIQTTSTNRLPVSDVQGSFQVDLVKRGFDVVTAEKIERDLLDTPPHKSDNINTESPQLPEVKIVQRNKDEPTLERSIETDSIATSDLQIVQNAVEEEEDDEVELSVHDCNEESRNYFAIQYDYTKEMSQEPPVRLKDTFSMNICIDDGVTVRLRATPFSLPLDQDPINVEEIDYRYDYRETELAVNSICNIEKLYTPLKESFKAQCYEIFDSTLTSLDTPLKANSPKTGECATTVTEIMLEEVKTQKDKSELKKRKRSTSSEESTSDTKKTKYLLTSASIQNIDIESVLTKLHGP